MKSEQFQLESGETVELPLGRVERFELSESEIVQVAVDAFLKIRHERGDKDIDAGAMADAIDERTGVGYGAAMLVASSGPTA